MYGKLEHRMFAPNAHWMWISRVYDQAASPVKLLQQSSPATSPCQRKECDAIQKTRTDVQYGSISHGVTTPPSMLNRTPNGADITKIHSDIDFISPLCYKIARLTSTIPNALSIRPSRPPRRQRWQEEFLPCQSRRIPRRKRRDPDHHLPPRRRAVGCARGRCVCATFGC